MAEISATPSTSDEPGPPSFPFRRSCPFKLPAQYRELRDAEPVSRAMLPDGESAWLVTRHEDVRAALTDQRISATIPRPGFGDKPPPAARARPKTFIQMDPPDHGLYRSLLTSAFTRRRINEMRPGLERTIDELIDELLGGPRPAELVSQLSLPFSSLTICQLLGVPYEDNEFFQSRTATIHDLSAAPADRLAARESMFTYLDEQIRRKRSHPDDGLLSHLAVQHLGNGPLTHEGLVGIAMLLLVAGHDTTANMVSLGILTLLAHPGQAELLRADPTSVPDTVEELLRYHSIGDLVTCRVARADIELGGRLIRAGERIMALTASANHDERVFPHPDEFDARRPERRHHLAFGFGVHQCLGQNLARMELELAYRAVFTRIPTLRLAAPVEELDVKDSEAVFGLRSLPVDW